MTINICEELKAIEDCYTTMKKQNKRNTIKILVMLLVVTYFKNKDYDEIEEFTEVNGFCTDCFKLCYLIPPNEVYDSNKAQIDLSELVIKDLDNILGYSYFNNNDKPDKKYH